jgi:hypothetical protein
MTPWDDTVLDRVIADGCLLLAIPVDPAWRDSIRINLRACLQAALFAAGLDLPDETDPDCLFAP